MRILVALLTGLFMAASVAGADTVRLKNGNTIEGTVLEKNADGIKIDIGGVTLTYYADEIESTDVADSVRTPAAVEPVPEQVPVVEAVPAQVVEAPAAVIPVEEPAPVEVPEVEVPAVPVAVPEVPAEVVPVEAPPVEAAPPAVKDPLADLGKMDLIQQFVQIYGVKQNMQANFDQMIASLTPDQAEAFRASVKVEDILQLLLPVYDKHFAADDLRAYINFYSSAEGKKLVQTLPLLMRDSVEVSMQYLDKHLPESLKEVQEPPSGK